MILYSSSFVAADNTLLTDFDSRFHDIIMPMWIQGNRAIGSVDGNNLTALTGITFNDDHWAEGVVGESDAGEFLVYFGVAVRCGAPDSGNGYVYIASGAAGSYLLRYDSGTYTVLASDSQLIAPADVMRLEAVGNVITPYLNGVPATMGFVTDSTYGSGASGLGSFRQSTIVGLSSFSAGDFLIASPGLIMPLFVPGL